MEGLLREGLITEGEYRQRRKKVLDIVSNPSLQAGSMGGKVTGKPSEGTWGHDGYEALYGGGGGTSARSAGGRSKAAGAPNDLRAKLSGGRAATGDLRAKLSGGERGIIKPMPGGGGIRKHDPKIDLRNKLVGQVRKQQQQQQRGKGPRGPARCPW